MEHIFPDSIERQFAIHRIDKELTLSILDRLNRGEFDSVRTVAVSSVPEPDGRQILDTTRDNITLEIPRKRLLARLEELLAPDGRGLIPAGDPVRLDRTALTAIGTLLYEKSAFGVLNGGSATSYVDETKNREFDPAYFERNRDSFKKTATLARGRAKGISPAFTHPDGTPGPSFMELKMRALLLGADACRKAGGRCETVPLPLFQMTSVSNNDEIEDAYSRYRESPFLAPLIRKTGIDATRARSGIQPLIAAYTPSRAGRPAALFTSAYGKEGTLLPLPGGHGQNFIALRQVYRSLLEEGYRFAWLGNVDNLGTTPDPFMLAFLALSGKEAAFEFSFKTPIDVKGGILVRDGDNRLNCADIGPAIHRSEIERLDRSGKPVLFNCASAIFDLEKLCGKLDFIIRSLPTRFSDQKKDAGEYSQAEQVTWEVIGLLEDFLVFGVRKQERFLAAKLLTESLLTSGIGLESSAYPELGAMLHAGLKDTLVRGYGLKLSGGKWVPAEGGEA